MSRSNLEVIAFVPQPPASASGRYRVYQMARPLADLGVTLDVRPFLDGRAFARLYRPGEVPAKAVDIIRGAARRWSDLGAASRYALAMVHREIWPLIGGAPLARLAGHQPRWVFDLDDPVWLPNVSAANQAFQWLKPFAQPPRLAEGARAVAAGNAFLADWARRQRPGRPAEEVEVIPTAVDADLWVPRPRDPGPPRLVWIGSQGTAAHLELLREPLARLATRHAGLELHVIGATVALDGIRVVEHAWSEATEVALVGRGDIGLAPLPDNEWSRGKCGLKLLLYMACGLPAVASRTGVHPEIVAHGGNGWLVDSPGEFEPALDSLLADADLRARLGAAARVTVESRYSVRAVAPRLAALLQRAAESA
jgi:glycosyltransferase involved in cell wall biosynthesis